MSVFSGRLGTMHFLPIMFKHISSLFSTYFCPQNDWNYSEETSSLFLMPPINWARVSSASLPRDDVLAPAGLSSSVLLTCIPAMQGLGSMGTSSPLRCVLGCDTGEVSKTLLLLKPQWTRYSGLTVFGEKIPNLPRVWPWPSRSPKSQHNLIALNTFTYTPECEWKSPQETVFPTVNSLRSEKPNPLIRRLELFTALPHSEGLSVFICDSKSFKEKLIASSTYQNVLTIIEIFL